MSRVVANPAGIPAAYEQARRAVHVGRQLQGTSSMSFFDDLGAFRLLSLIEDEDETVRLSVAVRLPLNQAVRLRRDPHREVRIRVAMRLEGTELLARALHPDAFK